MEERLRFVARLLDGEAMSNVCREFGISRKTGYKIFDRYKEHGLEALSDRSRRPVRCANQLPAQIETLILCVRAGQRRTGGDGGIRTLDRPLQAYNGLANRRLQPLGHISVTRRYARRGGRPQATDIKVAPEVENDLLGRPGVFGESVSIM